ncbi:hypothetical protein DPEC_G00198780 [Dallia pectoralis]|uniref:Uncharacterized protein n=1 Tax=Dallia pectoralis TaxID=75939 RepID=A0ACC2G8S2_DALPE|nr:hypothetical protein DPEC_G00198780 [Dallia pectoralis]
MVPTHDSTPPPPDIVSVKGTGSRSVREPDVALEAEASPTLPPTLGSATCPPPPLLQPALARCRRESALEAPAMPSNTSQPPIGACRILYVLEVQF